jgi:hypothetical protein
MKRGQRKVATGRHVDTLLVVMEPYYKVLETARRRAELGRELGIRYSDPRQLLTLPPDGIGLNLLAPVGRPAHRSLSGTVSGGCQLLRSSAHPKTGSTADWPFLGLRAGAT